ncbi:MAG TPA: DUF2071 domain-containing protein [Candidatus Saccharimonadales bacterium]|nr:DUF2071 domain-containing protein [Candidatus Saccharimonadales bacterium]
MNKSLASEPIEKKPECRDGTPTGGNAGSVSLLTRLRRHPFPVLAWFDRVVAVSFAFPENVLRPLVPEGLEIDTYEGLGFVTVAMVWTKQLRPAGFPAFLGQDFFLAGYRIFTRLRDESGRRLRGLKIIRSETDKRRMVWSGNLLTRYNYRHVKVAITESASETRVRTALRDGTPTIDLTFDARTESATIPAGSPFPDWHTARLFAGPMPFTFSPESDGTFVVIEGSRQNWVPRPVTVKNWCVGLFAEPALAGTAPILANAFAVEAIPYRWDRGRVVRPAVAM